MLPGNIPRAWVIHPTGTVEINEIVPDGGCNLDGWPICEIFWNNIIVPDGGCDLTLFDCDTR